VKTFFAVAQRYQPPNLKHITEFWERQKGTVKKALFRLAVSAKAWLMMSMRLATVRRKQREVEKWQKG